VNDIRTKIAAGATILGLGGLAGYAINSNSAAPPDPASAQVAAHTRPKVRTQTIRRTVHVRPDPKLADPALATSAPSSAAPAPAGTAPAPASTPAVTSTPVSAPKPVSTHSSGGGSASSSSYGDGEHEREDSERGDD
jgi:hypothetical protein